MVHHSEQHCSWPASLWQCYYFPEFTLSRFFCQMSSSLSCWVCLCEGFFVCCCWFMFFVVVIVWGLLCGFWVFFVCFCFVFNERSLQSVATLWGIVYTSNFKIFSEIGILFPACNQTWIKMLHWMYLETISLSLIWLWEINIILGSR